MSSQASRPTILFLTGGRSAEREIALLSAQNIYPYLCALNCELLPVLVTAAGKWLFVAQAPNWPDLGHICSEDATAGLLPVSLEPSGQGLEFMVQGQGQGQAVRHKIDLIFPVMHGPFGEDGTVQGLAQFFDLPVVGSDMSGSSVNMDKVLMKAILDQQGIATTRYRSLSAQNLPKDVSALGAELFSLWQCPSLYVKPARMGSSIGMTQVKRAEELAQAIDLALRYDEKFLIEEGLCALELEIAVLEAKVEAEAENNLIVSNAAQIRSRGEFYSFEQKYFPEKQKHALQVEAHNDLPSSVIDRAKALARKAYIALGACHYARVDLFYLEAEDRLLFNEINTIPGFTEHSMFPQLMAKEAWPMAKLIPHLVQMALQNYRSQGMSLKSEM